MADIHGPGSLDPKIVESERRQWRRALDNIESDSGAIAEKATLPTGQTVPGREAITAVQENLAHLNTQMEEAKFAAADPAEKQNILRRRMEAPNLPSPLKLEASKAGLPDEITQLMGAYEGGQSREARWGALNKLGPWAEGNPEYQAKVQEALGDLPDEFTVFRGDAGTGIQGDFANVTLHHGTAESFASEGWGINSEGGTGAAGRVTAYRVAKGDVVAVANAGQQELIFRSGALTPIDEDVISGATTRSLSDVIAGEETPSTLDPRAGDTAWWESEGYAGGGFDQDIVDHQPQNFSAQWTDDEVSAAGWNREELDNLQNLGTYQDYSKEEMARINRPLPQSGVPSLGERAAAGAPLTNEERLILGNLRGAPEEVSQAEIVGQGVEPYGAVADNLIEDAEVVGEEVPARRSVEDFFNTTTGRRPLELGPGPPATPPPVADMPMPEAMPAPLALPRPAEMPHAASVGAVVGEAEEAAQAATRGSAMAEKAGGLSEMLPDLYNRFISKNLRGRTLGVIGAGAVLGYYMHHRHQKHMWDETLDQQDYEQQSGYSQAGSGGGGGGGSGFNAQLAPGRNPLHTAYLPSQLDASKSGHHRMGPGKHSHLFGR